MVDKVIKNKLCTNCGTCISVCPTGAIYCKQGESNFEIKLEKKKCNHCGLCLRVCPGQEVDFENLNKNLFGEDHEIRHDSNLGYFRDCYLGYAKDSNIRSQCSSGGVVTSILIYLLKNKFIDGVLVTTMDSQRPLISKPFITYSETEIIEARGSKYTPVVLNQCLSEIIKSEKKKFAVVGLPCHIHGIRKLQDINPILKEKIKVCLGIMCGQGVNFSGTKFVLKQLGLKDDDVKSFRYRGDGWPGNITAISSDGQIKKIPYLQASRTFSMGFFTPERCFLCSDLTNELADISFGDAWMSRLMKRKSGINCVIARTKTGRELIRKTSQTIFYKTVDSDSIVESQKIKLFCKKESHKLLAVAAKFLGLGIPRYTASPTSKIKPLSVIVVITYLTSFFSNKYPKLFLKTPLVLWNLYLVIYGKILAVYKK